MNYDKIRTSPKFREIIDYIRAKCLLYGIKPPSIKKITEVMCKYIDKDKLFQNEFYKK